MKNLLKRYYVTNKIFRVFSVGILSLSLSLSLASLGSGSLFKSTSAKADDLPETTLAISYENGNPPSGTSSYYGVAARQYIVSVAFVNVDVNPPSFDPWNGMNSDCQNAGADPNNTSNKTSSVRICKSNYTDNTKYDITFYAHGKIYANPDSSYLFSYLSNSFGFTSGVDSAEINLKNFDCSTATDMTGMFLHFAHTVASRSIPIVSIHGFEKGFGQNATNMYRMFGYVASNIDTTATSKSKIELEQFPAGFGSKVLYCASMFEFFGSNTKYVESDYNIVFPAGFAQQAREMDKMFDNFATYVNVSDHKNIIDFSQDAFSYASTGAMFGAFADSTTGGTNYLYASSKANLDFLTSTEQFPRSKFTGNLKFAPPISNIKKLTENPSNTSVSIYIAKQDNSVTDQLPIVGYACDISSTRGSSGKFTNYQNCGDKLTVQESDSDTIVLKLSNLTVDTDYKVLIHTVFELNSVNKNTTGYLEHEFATRKVEYLLNYNANGGTGTMAPENFIIGETKKLENNKFTNGGKEFLCWSINPESTNCNGVGKYTNEHEYKFVTMEDVTLYAVWKGATPGPDPKPEPDKKYAKVHFNANGGKGNSYSQEFIVGETKKLEENKFTHSGANHYFQCWSLNAKSTACEGYGYWLNKENFEFNGEKDINLYAIWKETKVTKNKISINFNPTTGKLNKKYLSQLIEKGSKAAKPKVNPTKKGYKFVGWFTTAKSTKKAKAVNFKKLKLSKQTTFYAKYEKVSKKKPKKK